jgi:hypothetical protein
MKVFRFLLPILFSLSAFAQPTTVSGTVTDPNGIPYAYGNILPILNTPSTPKLLGSPYIPPNQAIALDSTGHFAFNIADNTQLTPPGTQWNFQVCSGAGTVQPALGKGPVCFLLPSPITISGSSQNITSNLAPYVVSLTVRGGNGGVSRGVAAGSASVSQGVSQPPIYQTKHAIDVRDYGTKCDGVTNDTTAANNALAAAVAVGSSKGTAEVIFPAGVCIANLYIQQGKGLRIHGTGALSTRIQGSGSTMPALQINGLWYSSFSDMSFSVYNHMTSGAAVEIDGDYDGTHHQSVQFLTFTNILFSGEGIGDGQYSYESAAVCRRGNACQGSNLKFDTVAFSGAFFATYFQSGYNALANVCIACDFQAYSKYAAYILFGDMGLYSSSGESNQGWNQVVNGGCDIYDGAAYYAMPIYDFRSESVLLLCGTGLADIRGINAGNNTSGGLCMGSCADNSVTWQANTAFSLGQVTIAFQKVYSSANPTQGIEGDNPGFTYYKVTTAGISGRSHPQWPYTGKVTDGTVVWTQQSVKRINLASGAFDSTGQAYYTTSASSANVSKRPHYRMISPNRTNGPAGGVITYNTIIDADDEMLLVDASLQDISITINSSYLNNPPGGGQVLIIRRIDPVDTSSGPLHTVTINSLMFQGAYSSEGGGRTITLPPDGYIELTYTSIGSSQIGWAITGGNYITFGNTAVYSNTAITGAVKLNAKSGFITTESLSTAAGADYVLIFTNNRISTNSVPLFNVMNGTNTGGAPTITTINTTTNGQAIVDIHNCGTSAFNGTLTLKFLVP